MLSVINRYLVQEFTRYFGLILAMVIGIYLAVDFFEKIDDFIEAGLPFSLALKFFLFKTPFIIAQITPVGILLAVLTVFGLMSKNNEIVALTGSGISVYTLIRPVVAMGVLASLGLFFLSEVLVPITMGAANRIWLGQVRQKTLVITREKNIWVKVDSAILHIKSYHPAQKTITGIGLTHFDDNFKLKRRIDAQKGVFKNGVWELTDVIDQRWVAATGSSDVTVHTALIEDLGIVPEDLKQVNKKSEELSFAELRRHIRKMEREGYDATLYRVDLHAKVALPFVCIIMCIVGTGLGMQGKLKDGLPVSITYGIGIAFLYWVINSFCLSLGYSEMLPPLLAAWVANFLFLCLALILVLNAE